jgi:acyl-CoA synthetase (AMP-forming)/AMP-acid ligase II
MSMDLWPALLEVRRPDAGWHCWTGERFEWTTWQETIRSASCLATDLRAAGVRNGTPVGAVLTNTPLTVRGLLAIWIAGGTVASLPVPARGMGLEEYREQLRGLSLTLGAQLLMMDAQLEPHFAGALGDGVEVRAWESLRERAPMRPDPPAIDDVAFIQYSSGSTSMPKGCMLTPRAIAAQLEIIATSTGSTPGEEVVVSWLPLSHDMGMFGCLLFPLAFDFDLALSTPERFTRAPRTWFGDFATFRGTMGAGTNTALAAATRMSSGDSLGSLESVRVIVIGAERIDWGTLQAAIEKFRPYDLKPAALMPAYGLAEATLIVTTNGVLQDASTVAVDTAALADGDVVMADPSAPTATTILAVGRPAEGVVVTLTRDGRLAEIEVTSPSLSAGYFGDHERTAQRFGNGVLRTGDLGFMRDGQLYVVGRMDDMISVAGRNIYAREIEAAVDLLPTVRSGCSTIVDIPDGASSRLVMLMELRDGDGDYEQITSTVARIAMSKAGVGLGECVFMPKGGLPKTPSGKIQRFRCRQMLTADTLEPVARVWACAG